MNEAHEVLDYKDHKNSGKEEDSFVVPADSPDINNKCTVGEDTNDSHTTGDPEPTANGVSLGGENPPTKVDYLVFFWIQGDDPRHQHQRQQKWHDGGKQNHCCESYHQFCVPLPGEISFVIVHVSLHPILLFIENIQRLEIVQIEGNFGILLSLSHPFVEIESGQGYEGHDDQHDNISSCRN